MCSAADCFRTGLQRGSRSLTSYVIEGICGRFGFVSTDGLLGYRLTRGFGLDDVGSQLHVSGIGVFRGFGFGHMTMCERFSLVKDSSSDFRATGGLVLST